MDDTGIEVFISSASEDYPSATEVFRHLSSLGIRCFFSEDTLDQLGQTQYKQVIESALEQCRHLILVTSSRANAEKKWVQHEWQTFDNECLSSRKDGNLVTLACSGLTPAELPWTPRNRIVLRWPAEKDRLISYVGRKRTPTPVAAPVAEDVGVPLVTAPDPEPEPGWPEPVGQDAAPSSAIPEPSAPPDIPPVEAPRPYDPMANWSPAVHRLLLWILAVAGVATMVIGALMYLWSGNSDAGAICMMGGGGVIGAAIAQWARVRKLARLSQATGPGGAPSPQTPPVEKPKDLADYSPGKQLFMGLLCLGMGGVFIGVPDGRLLYYGIITLLFGLYCIWLAIAKWWARWKGR